MPTKIEWATEVWNPISGCSSISEGCAHCWAKRMAQRLKGRFGYPEDEPFKVTLHSDKFDHPLKWKKPRQIFVVSMGDLFHEDVPFQLIAAIFGVMSFCQDHTFMVLTKRYSRMASFFNDIHGGEYSSNFNWWLNEACSALPEKVTHGIRLRPRPDKLPLPNVWLGVTAENQQRADERIPILLQISAAKYFISHEPGLGLINYPSEFLALGNRVGLITGGESGPGARPMHPNIPRHDRDQCQEAGLPFFFKQWGEWYPTGLGHYISCDSVVNKHPVDWNLRTLSLYDGREITGRFQTHIFDQDKPTYQTMYRIGKKHAGRLLDGREWNQMPA